MKRKFLCFLIITLFSVSTFTQIPFASAAELLNDGFESNDFSAWTGTSGSPSIDTDPVHHGTYSMYCDSDEYVYLDFTNTNDPIYCRVYFRSNSLPTDDYYKQGVCGFGPVGYHDFAYHVAVYRDPADQTCKFTLFDHYTSAENITDVEVAVDTWYCIEIMYDRNALGYLWIDDVEKATLDCPNLATNWCFVGTYESNIGTCNLDCVIIDEARIYGEEEGTETTVSSEIPLTTGITGNLAWSFLKLETIPFELTLNGLDSMVKTSLSTIAVTLGLAGLQNYASNRLSAMPLQFGVNGLKAVEWNPLTSIPLDLSFFSVFTAGVMNFLNIFTSIDLTASLSWLGAFAFTNGFTATLTFASNGLKAAAFQIGNQFTLNMGFNSVLSAFMNVLGSLNLGFAVNTLRALSFDWLSTLSATFSFNSVTEVLSAGIINVFGSIGFGFAINTLRSLNLDWLATIPFAFGFNAVADFLSQNLLNIAGSIPITFTTSLSRIVEFMLGGSISSVLGLASSLVFTGLPTALNIFGLIGLTTSFIGEFPFGEWLTSQFNQWFIFGAVIFSLIVGTLVFSIMRLRKKEED